MNRVVLGEMRDSEAAEAFIDVCSSGHPGMSTIHARSARDALGRLELFLTRAQGNIGIESIRKQIANSVSVVVYIGLDFNDRKRRIREVVEVNSASDGALQLSPIFAACQTEHGIRWRRDGGLSAFQETLKSGMALCYRDQATYSDVAVTLLASARSCRRRDEQSTVCDIF